MKQDTSWDIGGSVPEPAVPTIAVKQVILFFIIGSFKHRCKNIKIWHTKQFGLAYSFRRITHHSGICTSNVVLNTYTIGMNEKLGKVVLTKWH